MNLSQSVIDDLAVTWIGLHRSAAPPHLEHMIEEMRQTGDVDGVANYARLLKAVLAIQRIGPPRVSPPARPDIGQTLRNAREDLSASSS
jgi:hypothetical protein